MTQQFDRKRASNFTELTRRFEQLKGENNIETSSVHDGEGAITAMSVPPSDPTGIIELLETMRHETILHERMLAEKFPFWESIYPPVPLPWQRGYKEADCEVTALIERAVEYVKGLERDTDYVIFNDPSGEVVTFHFRTEEARTLFRRAAGLDETGGFKDFVQKIMARINPAES